MIVVSVLDVGVEAMLFQCGLGEVVRLLISFPIFRLVPKREGLQFSRDVRRDPPNRGDAVDVLQNVGPEILVFVLKMLKLRVSAFF